MKTFESYSYSSSRHTKVNMLTAAIQMKYKLRHEQNSYWFKICNQKCTTGWKSQSFWLMLQSARISHQKWPWLKQYTFQSMSYTTNFIPNCGIVIGWTQLWSFTCPPYWYNQSQGIKQHEQWMAANGKMFIPSLKTRIAQNLSVGFGHTHTHTHTWAHPNMIQYTHIFLQNKEHRFFFSSVLQPNVGHGLLILEVSRSHLLDVPVGRTPLDEWSAHRRDLYLTTHNRQTSMPSAGFEPIISAGEWPQTYALDHVATRTSKEHRLQNDTMWLPKHQVNVWLSTTPQIYNQECGDKWSASYSYSLSPSTFWIDYYTFEQKDITTFSQTSTINNNCAVYAHCIAAVTEFWILHKRVMFTQLRIPCHGLCRQILFICCYSVPMTS